MFDSANKHKNMRKNGGGALSARNLIITCLVDSCWSAVKHESLLSLNKMQILRDATQRMMTT